jgi:hypothetical protein
VSTRISDKEVSSRVRIILASRTIGGPLKTRAASGIADFNELIAKAQEKAPFRRWLDRGQRRRDLEALGCRGSRRRCSTKISPCWPSFVAAAYQCTSSGMAASTGRASELTAGYASMRPSLDSTNCPPTASSGSCD